MPLSDSGPVDDRDSEAGPDSAALDRPNTTTLANPDAEPGPNSPHSPDNVFHQVVNESPDPGFSLTMGHTTTASSSHAITLLSSLTDATSANWPGPATGLFRIDDPVKNAALPEHERLRVQAVLRIIREKLGTALAYARERRATVLAEGRGEDDDAVEDTEAEEEDAVPLPSQLSTLKKKPRRRSLRHIEVPSTFPKFILQSLPLGYAVFQKERTKDGTKTKGSYDTYIYGSTYAHHFRSTDSFVPHIEWIDRGMVGVCRCENCRVRREGRPRNRLSTKNAPAPESDVEETTSEAREEHRDAEEEGHSEEEAVEQHQLLPISRSRAVSELSTVFNASDTSPRFTRGTSLPPDESDDPDEPSVHAPPPLDQDEGASSSRHEAKRSLSLARLSPPSPTTRSPSFKKRRLSLNEPPVPESDVRAPVSSEDEADASQ